MNILSHQTQSVKKGVSIKLAFVHATITVQLGDMVLLHEIGGLCCISLYQEESGILMKATSCLAYAEIERSHLNGNDNGSRVANSDIKFRRKTNIIVDEVVGALGGRKVEC
jgi:hypothetical protein